MPRLVTISFYGGDMPIGNFDRAIRSEDLIEELQAQLKAKDQEIAHLKSRQSPEIKRPHCSNEKAFVEESGAELALAEWRMQQALFAGHSFTFDWDPTTDQVQRSDSCVPILGLSSEVAIHNTGQDFFQRIHPDDRDRFLQILQALTPETANYSTEFRVMRGDGTIIVLEETAMAQFDVDGRLKRVIGVATDISTRKQAEAELRRSEGRYRLLHESLRDGFVQVTMEGRIIDCNEVYSRMLGYSAEELRLLTYIQITPECWHKIEAAIVHDQILPRGYSDIYEKEYRRKEGNVFPVELRTILLCDDDGKPSAMWAIVRDITQRKKNEQELKALNDELERRVELRTQELQETQAHLLHIEKLSAIGKLSASIAHEFNSPLQTVMTVLKVLRLGGPLGSEEQKLLEAAIGESERMKNLIRCLQDFYRPSPGRKILMNLHATLDSLLLLHKFDLNRKNIKIESHYKESLPHIMAIPDQIKQVFLNLLNNAAEACLNEGGMISISTWQENDKVAVAIKDTGIGIQPSDIENIFRPFFSTKAETKGTGLGLSVSYGIIKNHRGDIRVESKPGVGTTFTILLPINE